MNPSCLVVIGSVREPESVPVAPLLLPEFTPPPVTEKKVEIDGSRLGALLMPFIEPI